MAQPEGFLVRMHEEGRGQWDGFRQDLVQAGTRQMFRQIQHGCRTLATECVEIPRGLPLSQGLAALVPVSHRLCVSLSDSIVPLLWGLCSCATSTCILMGGPHQQPHLSQPVRLYSNCHRHHHPLLEDESWPQIRGDTSLSGRFQN